MKKTIAIILILALISGFAACDLGTNNPDNTQKPQNTAVTTYNVDFNMQEELTILRKQNAQIIKSG